LVWCDWGPSTLIGCPYPLRRSSLMSNGVTSSAVSSATEPARIIVFSGVPLQPRVAITELPCVPASAAAADPKTFQARVRLPATRAQTRNTRAR
jgi:hypothetical protein